MYVDKVGRHLLPGRILQGVPTAGPDANGSAVINLGIVHGGMMRAYRVSFHLSAELDKNAAAASVFTIKRGADVLATWSNEGAKIEAGSHFYPCDWTETLFEGDLLTLTITTAGGGDDLQGIVFTPQIEVQPV